MEEFYQIVNECRMASATLWKEVCSQEEEIRRLQELPYVDINQSVYWNEEEKARLIKAARGKLGATKRKYNHAFDPVIECIKNTLRDEYALSPSVADLVYRHAYDFSHSEGWEAVYDKARFLGEFAVEVLRTEKNPER